MKEEISYLEKASDEYIAKIKQELRNINVSRVAAFTDVFNRYMKLRAKDKSNLFRVNAVASIITRGGRITPSDLAKLLQQLWKRHALAYMS